MREKVVYICEICEAQHNTSAAALRCENKGRPEAPRFLSARIGGEVAAFGENGVSVAKLSGFFIERESHALLALGNHWGVCCDLDEYNGVPLEVFEPMSSGYFLRYVEPGGEMERAMVAWLNWCRQYDIEPDVTKATWFQDRATKQTSILNALTKVMEGEGQ